MSHRSEAPAPGANRLLTIEEAAEYLRLARPTLARWRCQGLGPAFVRLGSRIMYREADVAAFVERQRRERTDQRRSAAGRGAAA